LPDEKKQAEVIHVDDPHSRFAVQNAVDHDMRAIARPGLVAVFFIAVAIVGATTCAGMIESISGKARAGLFSHDSSSDA